jgi:hypothetical protein
MPMYLFNLNDDDTVVDTDGTELADVASKEIQRVLENQQVASKIDGSR